MNATLDWSGTTGDVWSRHWRETDRALEPVGMALDAAVANLSPQGPFRALDVGCGPGTTSLALHARRPDATIAGCDISRPLIDIARHRAAGRAGVEFFAEDAEIAAQTRGPFDLILSRHGVMFFADPARAFRTFRMASAKAGSLAFSCFQAWDSNPWAAELAAAAAGTPVAAPGREAGGFAFADAGYVRELLTSAGWSNPVERPVEFTYVAGEGVDEALALFAQLGPSSRVIEALPESDKRGALDRMRAVIERHARDGAVEFQAAAWIWTARAE